MQFSYWYFFSAYLTWGKSNSILTRLKRENTTQHCPCDMIPPDFWGENMLWCYDTLILIINKIKKFCVSICGKQTRVDIWTMPELKTKVVVQKNCLLFIGPKLGPCTMCCWQQCCYSTMALWYFGYSRKNTFSWENNILKLFLAPQGALVVVTV